MRKIGGKGVRASPVSTLSMRKPFPISDGGRVGANPVCFKCTFRQICSFITLYFVNSVEE